MKIAISIGDINGIGVEIALLAHGTIKKLCDPVYCINTPLLTQAATLLGQAIPADFCVEETGENFPIKAGCVDRQSGQFSYDSFQKAITLTQNGHTTAMVTLPVNKEAWSVAGIPYKGHTDAFAAHFPHSAPIMMLGCEKLYVSLFTHHIPLKDVPKKITAQTLTTFLCAVYEQTKEAMIGVLGLNPHAGDGGVLGDEETYIAQAIAQSNAHLGHECFFGPLVPDTAFLDGRFRHFVCMYHDQGLIVLKKLYFEESINATLNIPIIRTSVDHGTAFNIAYTHAHPSITSYINAVKTAILLARNKHETTC